MSNKVFVCCVHFVSFTCSSREDVAHDDDGKNIKIVSSEKVQVCLNIPLFI